MTELIFILDRSGSMQELREDSIGGFNSLIEKQKEMEGECLVSTVLFNSESTVIHDRVPLKDVSPLTKRDFECFGCTALLDAVGSAIRHIKNVHKYARPEDRPEKTLVCIMTDGIENASNIYSYEDVKKKIESAEKYGWEFIFFGANMDSAKEAGRFGIKKERTVDYTADSKGTRTNYDMMADACMSVRSGKDLDAVSWRKNRDAEKEK